MKQKRFLLILCLIPFIFSCGDADDFKVAEPVTYYLRYEQQLDVTPGPSGAWNYVEYYIYPVDSAPTLTTVTWRVYLEKNIVKGDFGCDLIFWAASECQVKVEILLEKDGNETVLYTNIWTIHDLGEYNYTEYNSDAEINPLQGINPKSGKNKYLMLRFTHITGSVPVKIQCDGAIGKFGNSLITVFHDK